MKEIPLTKGKVALVDDEDYERISRWKWHYTPNGYAAHTIWSPEKKVNRGMHREVMQTPPGLETDHINGNKLDNRRENLRICTSSQNKANSGLSKMNTSGYKGVRWRESRQKWEVDIRKDGRKVFLGRFDDIIEAAKAYDLAAKAHYGEFAKLNFG